MKVSIVQAPIGPMLPEINRKTIFRAMEDALKDTPDVLVLPEMWNTGFYPDKFSPEDDYKEKALRRDLSAFAKEHAVNLVAGSLTVWDDGARRNRAFLYDRKGSLLGTYDKTHLFPVGAEKACFSPGKENLSFTLDETPCGIITCFELRIPEWVRLAVMGRAKVLFVPMAWGLSRIPHMHLFARARAVENQCFVVAVNCTKLDDYPAMGGGGSCIYSPTGEEILMTGTEACLHTVDLDLDQVDEAKDYFDLFHERRPDLYGKLVK
ncbi:MAG: nitrilase-related carbon-nitrogen hydrolase [Peptoniphilus sp.]|nr:nitrilase-related carbon-nitrogen hydrolase [Peptoniphilus sp.]MDY3118091.1 nitrilase-related carbon-nitrogen hydrolase [Peptoniphilus sp.]